MEEVEEARQACLLPLPTPGSSSSPRQADFVCKRKRKGKGYIVELEEEEGRVEGTPLPPLLIQRFCQRYNERVKKERGEGGKGGIPFFLYLPLGSSSSPREAGHACKRKREGEEVDCRAGVGGGKGRRNPSTASPHPEVLSEVQ